MSFSLRRAKAILLKESRQMLRDRLTVAMIVLIPIFQLLLFGYALNTDPKHAPTAVLARDNGELTRSFVAALKNTDYFSIDYKIDSPAQGHALLRQGKALFVVTIPPDFERDIIRGDRPTLLIEADASDPVAVSNALGALNGMMERTLAHVMTGAFAFRAQGPPPVNLMVHKLYNPEGFTRYNIVPGLVSIILTMSGVMMTALSITRERERGTLENTLAMPVSPAEMMAGKIIPYVMIGVVQAIIIVLFSSLLFAVPILGDMVMFGLMTLVFITCNIALGFMISTTAQNQTQAVQMSFMVMLPTILLSGFVFPFKGMPEWAQMLGSLLPARYFMQISRSVMLKGSGFVDMWGFIWPLIVIMIALVTIALRRYRRTLD